MSWVVWHFTPISRLERIMVEGLCPHIKDGRGATNTPGVYCVAVGDDRSGFIGMLYDEPVACLEVDIAGLPVVSGDDDEEDRPEFAVQAHVLPDRIKISTTWKTRANSV